MVAIMPPSTGDPGAGSEPGEMSPGDGQAGGDQSPALAWFLPVNDAGAFLKDNFTPAGAGASAGYKTGDGRVLFARALPLPEDMDGTGPPPGQHLMLSESASAIATYSADGELAVTVKRGLGALGTESLTKGEIIVIATPAGLKSVGAEAEAAVRKTVAEAEQAGGATPGVPKPGEVEQMFSDARAAAMAIDFDPLGLIVRWLGTFAPDTTWWARSTGGANGPDGLERLPRKPYLVAGAIDVNGLGGFDVFRDLMATRSIAVPEHGRSVEGVAFTLAPSTAGLSAGLLAEAALLLQTKAPDEVTAAAREWIQMTANAIAPPDAPGTGTGTGTGTESPGAELLWEESREVKDAGTAIAYEVTIPTAADEPMQRQLIRQVVFGRNGWKGFIKAVSGGVIVTFSQRPAVLAGAVQAAEAKPHAAHGEGTAGANKRSLADDGAIKMIRRWMPADRDVEMYFSVGQIAAVMQPIMQMMGGQDMQGPTIDSSLPPVGIAGDMQDHGLQGALVVPGAVLATVVDRMASQLMRPDGAPPARSDKPAAESRDGESSGNGS